MGEIADGDIHAVAVARPGLFRVTDEDSRPIAALEEAFNNAGPDVRRIRTCSKDKWPFAMRSLAPKCLLASGERKVAVRSRLGMQIPEQGRFLRFAFQIGDSSLGRGPSAAVA